MKKQSYEAVTEYTIKFLDPAIQPQQEVESLKGISYR